MNKLKTINLKLTNCYLIPVGSTYLLFDTGYDWEWNDFQVKLNQLNIAITDIGYLIISHHHDDHCGLLTHLKNSNPSLVVMASKPCFEYLKTGVHVHPDQFWHINKRVHWVLELKGKFDKKWTHAFPKYHKNDNDIVIEDDIAFKALGLNLNGMIIKVPGHSLDQIALIVDDEYCLCSDAASNFLRVLGLKNALISVDNWDDFYASWDKIIALGVKILYPAHGKCFTVDKLRKNLRKCKKENLVVN